MTKKITEHFEVKTFLFELKTNPYDDKVINDWLIKNRDEIDEVEVIWDIQSEFVFVSVTYIKLEQEI